MAALGENSLSGEVKLTLGRKLWEINWSLVALLSVLAGIGFAMLYSASGDWEPWASKQMNRFAIGFFVMIGLALVDVRFWRRWAFVLYAGAFALLILVALQGKVGMGAQRWLNLGPFQLQPSEVMKITLVLALASWFDRFGVNSAHRFLILIPGLFLLAAPIALVVKQPDLGTSLMLIMAAGAVIFTAGARWWLFVLAAGAVAAAAPTAWTFLRPYQQARVLVFLDPERDPLGAGYHIIQSKIALGSGGLFGKGFMQGTQSHLNFLPEKQTDFIFTMLAEEFGLAGGLGLLGLYLLLVTYGYAVALRCSHNFGRMVAIGLATNVFLSVFINTAMVMGMIPAKGVPLPMVSYGGTSMIVTMMGFGVLMGVWVHRDVRIKKRGEE